MSLKRITLSSPFVFQRFPSLGLLFPLLSPPPPQFRLQPPSPFSPFVHVRHPLSRLLVYFYPVFHVFRKQLPVWPSSTSIPSAILLTQSPSTMYTSVPSVPSTPLYPLSPLSLLSPLSPLLHLSLYPSIPLIPCILSIPSIPSIPLSPLSPVSPCHFCFLKGAQA